MSILLKKKTYKSKIFEKLNFFTENGDSKCKYYICDQLNSPDLEKHDKNVSNARKSQLNHIAKSQNY